jgi:hypothetical protein
MAKKAEKDTLGEIHKPQTLFLRVGVGEAKNAEDGHMYEMSTNMSDGAPIIQSKKTGKWFVLPWQDIIVLAVKAGIDQK